MRIIPTVLLMFGCLCIGCHKNDVEVAELTTNPYDVDHPWDPASPLMAIDTVLTAPTGLTGNYEQHLVVHVYPERFPAQFPQAYDVWVIERTVPETDYYSSSEQSSDIIVNENLHVELGSTYCYTVQLRVGGQVVKSIDKCALAEL